MKKLILAILIVASAPALAMASPASEFRNCVYMGVATSNNAMLAERCLDGILTPWQASPNFAAEYDAMVAGDPVIAAFMKGVFKALAE
jgi:hypothetical protein